MFLILLAIIFFMSFLMALYSLKKELKKPNEIILTKGKLMKEKILFEKD